MNIVNDNKENKVDLGVSQFRLKISKLMMELVEYDPYNTSIPE
jgi:hypothetical protein